MKKTYEKTYSNTGLTIAPGIWQDKTVNGMQKIVLQLVSQFTKSGEKTCHALTGQMSIICSTHEKDIKYNLQELHKKEYIKIFPDSLSPTGYSIQFTYYVKPVVVDTNDGAGDSLFDF